MPASKRKSPVIISHNRETMTGLSLFIGYYDKESTAEGADYYSAFRKAAISAFLQFG